MTPATPLRLRLRSLVPATVLCLGLASGLGACSDSSAGSSDGSSEGAGGTSSSEPTSSASGGTDASSSSLPVPAGVELTEQGSTLDLGDHAVVAYEPRQDKVGALDIRVDSAQRTTFEQSFRGWQLDQRTRRATPYFVHVRVENVGETNLGGNPVPLYIVDGNDTLIPPSTFASSYQPCPSTPFPEKFRHGDHVDTCLVYFAPRHGELTAVSFRPTQEFDPITWTGKVTRVGGKRGRG